MERSFSKRVARCPYDKERAKEPTRVGSRDRFAHCASRDTDHCAAVHNRDDPTGQVPRHSPDGPSCCAASAGGGGGGGAAGGAIRRVSWYLASWIVPVVYSGTMISVARSTMCKPVAAAHSSGLLRAFFVVGAASNAFRERSFHVVGVKRTGRAGFPAGPF